MPTYVRGFVISDVAEVHRAYQKLIGDLDELILLERRLGGNKTAGRIGTSNAARALIDVRISYRDFNLGLRRLAEKASVQATKDMITRLEANRRRPEKGSTPPLKDLVEANPLPPIAGYETGAVGVANVAVLNRAINPRSRGYGAYWRAIEYGTGVAGVPSQVGRILYGSFTGPGGSDPTAPDAQYRGGGGPHPVFIPGWQARQDGQRTSGLGTIGHEIKGKHFIRFGADGASVQWRAEIAALQGRAIDNLRAVRLGPS